MMILTARFTEKESITEAFTEAIRVSKILGISVSFTFNGIYCIAYPDLDIEDGVSKFMKDARSSPNYKFA